MPGSPKETHKNGQYPRNIETSLQLSYSQQSWWFLDQLDPGCLLGNLSLAVRISGPLNRTALERALNEVIQRHTILRTTISTEEGLPKLFEAPQLKLAFPLVDLHHVSPDEREQVIQRLAEEEARRPFDLAFGPLLRTVLLRQSDDAHTVLLTLHRIIADNWSTRVLLREIGLLNQAFSEEQPSPLTGPAIQYSEYAAWQMEQLQETGYRPGKGRFQQHLLRTQLAYWKERLANLPPRLELHTDRAPASRLTYPSATRWFELPPVLTARLKDIGQAAGCDLFTTLLAAFEILLYDYSGQEIFWVGSPAANRARPELESLVGPLENYLVLVADLSGDPTFRALIKKVGSTVRNARENQEIPIEKLVEMLPHEYNPRHLPLFQVRFSLQEALSGLLSAGNLTLYPTFIESGITRFDLSLSLLERNGQLMGALGYNLELFEESTIQEMLLHFKRLLDEVMANPDLPVSRRSWLPDPVDRKNSKTSDPVGRMANQWERPGLSPGVKRPDSTWIAPRNEAEAILAGIWKAVLGVEKVSVNDHFFTLGGNSLLSLQLISRAARAGLHLSLRQVYQNPTIAGLAAITTQANRVQAEQGQVQGASCLTPAQLWFFRRWLPDPPQWNEAVLLTGTRQLHPELLEETIGRLISHHDALRLHFPLKDGSREACYASPEELMACTYIDLRGFSPEEQGRAVERLAAKLQSSLDIEKSPLLKAAYFDLGPEQPGRLLLVAHQLVIDGFSWQVLLEDLESIYDQLQTGGEVRLPYKTTSYKYWANKLAEDTRLEARIEETSDWLQGEEDVTLILPVDRPKGDNLEGSAQRIRTALNLRETQAFNRFADQAGEGGDYALLLLALYEAFSRWSGQEKLLFDLEDAGREIPFSDVSLNRTVGRFATFYPVLLEPDLFEPTRDTQALAKCIHQALGSSSGYRPFIIGNGDRPKQADLPASTPAPVCLRFTGQSTNDLAIGPAFRFVDGPARPVRSRRALRAHEWVVTGESNEEEIRLDWTYSSARYRRKTAVQLAAAFLEALRGLIGSERGWTAAAENLSLPPRQVNSNKG